MSYKFFEVKVNFLTTLSCEADISKLQIVLSDLKTFQDDLENLGNTETTIDIRSFASEQG